MAAVTRNLSGGQLDFVREVELYFDIRPETIGDDIFEAADAEIDNLLPGHGSLSERTAAWRKSPRLEPDKILPVLELALYETHRRTLQRFQLTQGEAWAYVERYGLRTPEEASHSMRILTNRLSRSYVFNYAVGKALLAPLLEGPVALVNFERLLREPFTPSQVRSWLAQGEPESGPVYQTT